MQETPRPKITSFKDLEAWKQGHLLAVSIYQASKQIPKEEQFGIINQMRRAAVSVTSNIAEGFSRQSSKDKAHFYSMAQGSLTELQNQLLISRDVGYIPGTAFNELDNQTVLVHKLITGLIKYARGIVRPTP